MLESNKIKINFKLEERHVSNRSDYTGLNMLTIGREMKLF